MNFHKESKYEEKFLFWGEEGGGECRISTEKKNKRKTIGIRLFFVRGITLPMFYGIQSKVILTQILNNLLNCRILAQAILYILR